MSLESKGTRRLIGLLAGLGVVSVAGIAEAATVQLNTGVLLVKQSTDAKVKRGTGAGILMPRLEQMAGNKVMAIWMDSAPDSTVPPSDANDNNGYWEGKVAMIQLNAEAAPTIVTTKQISNFDGDRPFNHPRLASAGDYAVVNFASTIEDPNTTNQYVMIVDSSAEVPEIQGTSLNGDNQVTDSHGNVVKTVLNVGENDGDNHGAAEMHYVGKDTNGVDHFLGGYLHNNNDTYIFGLSVQKSATGYRVTQDWKTLIARPANIGRPTCAVTGATTATCCAAKGNNRPPEIGIQCVAMDTTKGTILNKVIVAPSNPEQKVYMNQPTITYLGNNTCGLGVVMSDGQGRNRNGHFLGTNTSMAYTVDCTTLQTKNTQIGVAPFQRHAVIGSSLFGNQGQTFMGALGCSSTGAGAAGIQLIGVDSNGTMTVDKQNNMLPVMWQCDTAWLSYKGLRNPNNQGRDFLHALGSVPNPGFQDPKGWMPEVSHFAIAAVPAVKDQTSLRNSLFLSFIPIAWDKNVQVSMGAAVDVNSIAAGPSPQAGGGSPVVGSGDPSVNGDTGGSGGSGDGSGSGNGGSSSGPTHHHGFLGMSDSGGCSVSAVGAGPEEGLEGLALVGLGLAVAASRRRRA
jgi:MYXO-CTERM domain-containing protein